VLHQCRTLLLLHRWCPPPDLNCAIALIIIIFFFAPPRSSSFLRHRTHHRFCTAALIIFFAPPRMRTHTHQLDSEWFGRILLSAPPCSSSSLCRRTHHLLRAFMVIIFFAPSQSSSSSHHQAVKLPCAGMRSSFIAPLCALPLCIYCQFLDPLYLTPCVLWC